MRFETTESIPATTSGFHLFRKASCRSAASRLRHRRTTSSGRRYRRIAKLPEHADAGFPSDRRSFRFLCWSRFLLHGPPHVPVCSDTDRLRAVPHHLPDFPDAVGLPLPDCKESTIVTYPASSPNGCYRDHVRRAFGREVAVENNAAFGLCKRSEPEILKVFFQPLLPLVSTVQRAVIRRHDHHIVGHERNHRLDVAGFRGIDELLPIEKDRIVFPENFGTHGFRDWKGPFTPRLTVKSMVCYKSWL